MPKTQKLFKQFSRRHKAAEILFMANYFFRRQNRYPQISSLKKTSRLGGFARKSFVKIRVYSWFPFFYLFKNFAAWRLRAKKKAFPQPKPRERPPPFPKRKRGRFDKRARL